MKGNRNVAVCPQTPQALRQFVAVSVAEGVHNRGDGGSVVGGAVGWQVARQHFFSVLREVVPVHDELH